MKLDKTFSRELRQINGDGSREAKFAFLTPAKAAARELSTPTVATVFPSVVRKYGCFFTNYRFIFVNCAFFSCINL